MHFYTSINNKYLPKARVLAKTLKEHCKNVRFSLVLSDTILDGFDLSREPFDEILTIEDLGLPVKNLDFWIFTYTVVELCTAVKGQALVKFLEEGSDKVIYLDPDIAVFGDLTDLEHLLDRHDIILTPHQTTPETTMEAIIDNEICSLKHGVYNFGFYAVKNSDNGLAFARWWRDRLVNFCYDDIPNGLFTDQKWGDIVPCLFDSVYILREPGYNVCTWNLTHRIVAKDSGGNITVNGQPLQFYHFSGFDSGAQHVMLRKYAKRDSVLFELREWYIRRQNEEGQEKYGEFQSRYDFYDDGTPVNKEERHLLRARGDLADFFGDVNPYVVQQEKSYRRWYLQEQVRLGMNFAISSAEQELQRIYASKTWKIARFITKVWKVFKRGGRYATM